MSESDNGAYPLPLSNQPAIGGRMMAEPQCSAAEEWRVIPGHANYEVSSLGGVRRIGRRVLKPSKSPQGYLTVSLGTGKTLRVQRLVLFAFIGDPPTDKPLALHRNAVRDDNRFENLYWGSAYDNTQDMIRMGRAMDGPKQPISKLTEADIKLILTSPLSHSALARQLGVHLKTVARVRSGTSYVRSAGRVDPVAGMGTEGNPAKITVDQVREIRARHARGEQVKDFYRDYPITRTSVYRILNREKWKGV